MMSPAPTCSFVAAFVGLSALLASLDGWAEASAFLSSGAPQFEELGFLNPDLKRTLLAEIETALGADRFHTEGLDDVQQILRPILAALPKNEYGKFGSAVSRYALHRLFQARQNWHVRGIEPTGETWNSSSPTDILRHQVSEDVQELFDQRLGGHGFDLLELATLAKLIENLVRQETTELLRSTLQALHFTLDGTLSKTDVTKALDAYMAAYIVGLNISALDPAQIDSEVSSMPEAFPGWESTQNLVEEVRQNIAPESTELNFESLTAVVHEVGGRFKEFMSVECRTVKEQLIEMEDGVGSGRVRLADFYRGALDDGNWQFMENSDYLRQLGALDESDPTSLRLIIPNYVNSPANCLAPSRYHAICCPDECEEVRGHLERQLVQPNASPGELAIMVASLPSATVPGNRTLPASLLRRLDEIAEHHGGYIPLHGRLFNQFLHFAYPRECPYPHVSGTTSPQRPDDWAQRTGLDMAVKKEEMEQYMDTSPRHRSAARGTSAHDEDDVCSGWTAEEELVAPHVSQAEHVPAGGSSKRAFMRGAALILALGSAWSILARTVTEAWSGTSDRHLLKHNL